MRGPPPDRAVGFVGSVLGQRVSMGHGDLVVGQVVGDLRPAGALARERRSSRPRVFIFSRRRGWPLSLAVCVFNRQTKVHEWRACRCKFIARKSQFICASDDMRLRIYNYNTMEKIKEVEAHADYIRYARHAASRNRGSCLGVPRDETSGGHVLETHMFFSSGKSPPLPPPLKGKKNEAAECFFSSLSLSLGRRPFSLWTRRAASG